MSTQAMASLTSIFDAVVFWSLLELLRAFFASLVFFLRDAQGAPTLAVGAVGLGALATAYLAGRSPHWRVVRSVHAGCAVLFFRLLGQALLAVAGGGWSPFLALGIGVIFAGRYLRGDEDREGDGEWGRRADAWVYGLVLDFAVHLGLGGWDAHWRSDAAAWLVTAIQLALGLAAGWRLVSKFRRAAAAARLDVGRAEHESDVTGARMLGVSMGALAFGPLFFLIQVVFLNAGWFSVASGWALPGVGVWVLSACAVAAWLLRKRAAAGGRRIVVAAAVLFALAVGLPEQNDAFARVLVHTIGLIAALTLFRESLRRMVGACRITRATAWLGYGIWVFLYYAGFDVSFPFSPPSVLTAAAVVSGGLVVASLIRGEVVPPAESRPIFGVSAVLALGIFPVFLKLGWWEASEVPKAPALTAESAIRILTYNVHQGFDTRGRLDPEAIAEVIRESGAEIVLLQEVDRGWLIDGSIDLAQWLSQRLRMRFEFAPTADGRWGLATLSRLEPIEVAREPLPSEGLRLARGSLVTRYRISGTPAPEATLHVVNTHLHHRLGDSDIRRRQVESLVRLIGDTPYVVLAGDFNAVEEMPELDPLWAHGLRDSAEGRIFPTFPASSPKYRIDYITATPDIRFADTLVQLRRASDHLPVSTRIELGSPRRAHHDARSVFR